MEQSPFDRTRLFSALLQIGHGDLQLFADAGLIPAAADPEMFAHFLGWNAMKSQVRDSKVAFPVIALRGLTAAMTDYAENAIAHLMLFGPRELSRAYQFSKSLSAQGKHPRRSHRIALQQAIQKYLRVREAKRGWWERAVLSNREAMLDLYAVSHIKPAPFAQAILFDKQYPPNSIFAAIAALKQMPPQEAAGVILNYNIPFPIAVRALPKAKDPVLLLALIEQMTGNQLLQHSKALLALGVSDDPVLKAAFDAALTRAKSDKRVDALKAAKVVDVLNEEGFGDAVLRTRLEQVQTAQLDRIGGIEGDWLVLGDRSGSMMQSIELAKRIASLIAERVRGKVYLVFFNTEPRFFEVSGKSLSDIQRETKGITAGGGTSIGCGLDYLRTRSLLVSGIAIVSDGGDNTSPLFESAYPAYVKSLELEPTVYFFRVPGDPDRLTGEAVRTDKAVRMEVFDVGKGVDDVSLPNIIEMLKTSRYGLFDEIMQTRLLALSDVFDTAKE